MDSDKRFLLKYVAHVLILLICSICIWKKLWSVIDLILFKEIVSWILLILFSIFIFSYWNWPEVHGLNHCYVHRGSSVWSYCWVIFFFFKGTVREKLFGCVYTSNSSNLQIWILAYSMWRKKLVCLWRRTIKFLCKKE